MSKIAKVVCALAGAAVNGAVAAVSGGNPILVALSGGATSLVAEEVGEIVREDEICYLAKEKPEVFAKLVEKNAKDAKKVEAKDAPKAVAELMNQLIAEQKLQNSALALLVKPMSEKAATEAAEKAEKAAKVERQKAEDEELAMLVPLLDKVEAYKARMAKAEKKAAANG
jgi:hypothetical protein